MSFELEITEGADFFLVSVSPPDFVPWDPPRFGVDNTQRLKWRVATFEAVTQFGSLDLENVGSLARMKMGGQEFTAAIVDVHIESSFECGYQRFYTPGQVSVTYTVMMVDGMENLDGIDFRGDTGLEFFWPETDDRSSG